MVCCESIRGKSENVTHELKCRRSLEVNTPQAAELCENLPLKTQTYGPLHSIKEDFTDWESQATIRDEKPSLENSKL